MNTGDQYRCRSLAQTDPAYVAARAAIERGRSVDPLDPPAVDDDPAKAAEQHLTDMVRDHWGLPEPRQGKRTYREGVITDEDMRWRISEYRFRFKARYGRDPATCDIVRGTKIPAADVRRLLRAAQS